MEALRPCLSSHVPCHDLHLLFVFKTEEGARLEQVWLHQVYQEGLRLSMQSLPMVIRSKLFWILDGRMILDKYIQVPKERHACETAQVYLSHSFDIFQQFMAL